MTASPIVTPMLWWSQTQLEALGARLKNDGDQWLGDWACSTPAMPAEFVRVMTCNAHDQAEIIGECRWTWVGGQGTVSVWLGHMGSGTGAIADALFDDAGRRGVAGLRIAASALDELRAALVTSLRLEVTSHEPQDKPGPLWARPWSGLVLCQLEYSGVTVRMLIGAETVAALLNVPYVALAPTGGDVALAPLIDALAEQMIHVRLGLTPFEIDVGDLMGLSVNDVLQLNHSLEEPLTVSSDTFGELCRGYLGRHGRHLAVELTSPAAFAL